ncbi:MAG: carboxypeptidase M32, partial [Bacillota bacterium]|nr:carboxypeptidase M32 [Bacillota bacterium]
MTEKTLEINVTDLVTQFNELDQKLSHFSDILGQIGWDSKTMAPKKGRPHFAKAIGTLSTESFKLSVSNEMGELLETLTSEEVYSQLDEVTKACVRERKADYDKTKSIPADLYKEFVVTTSNANDAWEEAREKNDFSIFQPFLEKIVGFVKQFTDYYGFEGHRYNALLDAFEPGLTVERLDPLFAELREKSVQLLKRIQNSPSQPRKDIFELTYEIEKQKEFNQFLLPKIGFDMNAGRLDESVHPFAQPVNTGDVRITTRYLQDNVRSAIFG